NTLKKMSPSAHTGNRGRRVTKRGRYEDVSPTSRLQGGRSSLFCDRVGGHRRRGDALRWWWGQRWKARRRWDACGGGDGSRRPGWGARRSAGRRNEELEKGEIVLSRRRAVAGCADLEVVHQAAIERGSGGG